MIWPGLQLCRSAVKLVAMGTHDAQPVSVKVGGLSRDDLRQALDSAGVRLNDHAETLLDSGACDEAASQHVTLVERSVADLGFARGATLPQIFAAASAQGLGLCPLATAPYLRLVLTDQEPAGDADFSQGRAPSGSLTVASLPISEDHQIPKGFYLRAADGVLWLRGYRCDDLHVHQPEVRFVFHRPCSRR